MTGERNWFRHDAAARRLSLTLHIQPGAKKSGIAGLHGDALKIRIAAPATDNQANAELIGYLSELLGIAKSAIAIRHGATGRRKIVEVAGDEETAKRVAALAAG